MACACSSGEKQVLQLLDTVKHNDNTYSFDFASLEPLSWREGDSSKLFVDIAGHVVGKKFSYATLPNEKVIRFTTRIRDERSDYKEEMARLSVGDFVEITSPGGHFTLLRDERPALLLSNGVGIATMRSLIKAYEKNPIGVGRMTQINVDSTGTIYDDEFSELESNDNTFKSIYVKHRSEFYKQLDYATQELMFATGRIPYFYVVGSDEFLRDVTASITSVGFDERDILTDGQSVASISSGMCGCGLVTAEECGCGSGGCGCDSTSQETGTLSKEAIKLQVKSKPSYSIKLKSQNSAIRTR